MTNESVGTDERQGLNTLTAKTDANTEAINTLTAKTTPTPRPSTL